MSEFTFTVPGNILCNTEACPCLGDETTAIVYGPETALTVEALQQRVDEHRARFPALLPDQWW